MENRRVRGIWRHTAPYGEFKPVVAWVMAPSGSIVGLTSPTSIEGFLSGKSTLASLGWGLLPGSWEIGVV